MEQAVDWQEIVTAEKQISESRKGRANRQRLFDFAVFDPINRQNHASRDDVFFQVKSAGDDDWSDRVLGVRPFFQADERVVVDRGSRAEAAFLVVTHENELLNIGLTSAWSDKATKAHVSTVEGFDSIGQHGAVEVTAFFNFET